MTFYMQSEPLGTRQMKWIDTWLYNYKLDNVPVKRIRINATLEENYATTLKDSREVAYPIDHRYRYPGEAILDIDYKSPLKSMFHLCDLANDISVTLAEKGEVPLICHSGGRGFHIHVFKDKETTSKALVEGLIEELKLQRLQKAGVIDNHLLEGRHLIREIGGRAFKDSTPCTYKSVIKNPHDFTPVIDRRKVIFPDAQTAQKMIDNMGPKYTVEVG